MLDIGFCVDFYFLPLENSHLDYNIPGIILLNQRE